MWWWFAGALSVMISKPTAHFQRLIWKQKGKARHGNLK